MSKLVKPSCNHLNFDVFTVRKALFKTFNVKVHIQNVLNFEHQLRKQLLKVVLENSDSLLVSFDMRNIYDGYSYRWIYIDISIYDGYSYR